MKVLTLTEPWAFLVVIGAKGVETRSWGTAYRGRLAIHAAKAFPPAARELCNKEPFRCVLRRALGLAGLIVNIDRALPTGRIIGTCDLVDCVRTVPSTPLWLNEPERSFGDFTAGRKALILRNPRRIEPGIWARGKLGLWEFEDARLR